MKSLNNKKSDIDSGAPRALFLFGLGLFAAIGLLLRLDRLKYPLAEFHQLGGGITATLKHAFTLLTPLDYTLAASVALLFAACIYFEVRRRELSSALTQAKPAQMMGLLLVLLIWFAHAYLYPGCLLGGDVGSHIARTGHFRMGLEQGQAIFWDNYFYLGSPFLQFTGPLYFWVSGIADLLLRDPNLTTKLLLFILRIAGGVFVYLFILRQGIGRFAGVVARHRLLGRVRLYAFDAVEGRLAAGDHPGFAALGVLAVGASGARPHAIRRRVGGIYAGQCSAIHQSPGDGHDGGPVHRVLCAGESAFTPL